MIVQFHLTGYIRPREGYIVRWETRKTMDIFRNECEEWIAVIEDMDSGLLYRVPKNEIIYH